MNDSNRNSSSLYDGDIFFRQHVYYLGIFRILIWFGLGVPTVVINSLILRGLVLAKDLPRPCRTLLVNLGCCDLLCGMTMMGNSVLLLKPNEVSNQQCAAGIGMFAILAVVSIILSTLFPINAYLSQLIPFRYRSAMGPVKVSVISVMVWFASVAVVASSLVVSPDEYESCNLLLLYRPGTLRGFAGLYVVCLVIMTSVFCKLYAVARSHICKIVSDTHLEQKEVVNVSLQKKALKTVSAIAASFWLTYTPLAMFLLIMSFKTSPEFFTIENVVLQIIFTTVFLTKSVANPLVYAWKIPFVREATHSLFRKLTKSRRQTITSLTVERTTGMTRSV